jgi:alpha-beta hydrolase superfamily lysophospholipase
MKRLIKGRLCVRPLSSWLLWPYRAVCLLAIGWVLICILLAVWQRRMIYHPAQVPALPPPETLPWATVEPLHYEAWDGLTLQGWRVRPRGIAAASTHPVVLYFPGNAGHREYRLDEFEVLVRAGAEVCCFDYRGYGENPGSPTEADLHRDARAAWNFLTQSLKIPERRIVLLGESLGGGVATRLAADLCTADEIPGGLVLRSTFNTLTDAASWHFRWLPVDWLLRDRFESQRCIGRVVCPVLCLHGERDTIVPLELGQRLYAAAPEKSESGVAKEFVPLPQADHNDVVQSEGELVIQALRQFLSRAVPPRG